MNEQEQQELARAELQPLVFRIRHEKWLVRKRAYENILACVTKVKSLGQEFLIGEEYFTVSKIAALLNNLVEEKHPNVLLKGLESVERILKLDAGTHKMFNKLVCEGLEKFPLVTQQRKLILEKFLDILEHCRVDANTLLNRLSLPQQKSVMFVIEVIGALGMHSLKKKLQEISKKNAKICVKELAAEIAEQLEDEEPKKKEEEKERAIGVKPGKKEEGKKALRMDLIDKLQHFEQLKTKEQQQYSEELLECIDEISGLPAAGQLTNFCYYLQLMIQDNNLIISSNGVKMLSALVRNRSQLLTNSFPLLFIFRKFKLHKTHPVNNTLLALVQAFLCSPRSNDLMNAVLEGMGSMQNKVNLKYGCIVSFIRIFSYFYRSQALFASFCKGQFVDLYERIENKKYVDKILVKCFELFCREKDRDYIPVIEKMKEIMGVPTVNTLTSQKSTKDINRSDSSSHLVKGNKVEGNLKTQPLPVKAALPPKSTKNAPATTNLPPQGQLNKILQLLEANKVNPTVLSKAIERCLKCTSSNLNEQIFDIFYYCEIIESFIEGYHPHEQSDEIISQFLIDYLKLLASAEIKPSKKNSKVTQLGIEYLLKISSCKLVLSKQIMAVLSGIDRNCGFEMLMKCLGSLFVTGREALKKKNKKYLLRWLDENTPEEFINNQYFELKQAIEGNGEKKEKTKQLEKEDHIVQKQKYEVKSSEDYEIKETKKNAQPLKKNNESRTIRQEEFEQLPQFKKETLREEVAPRYKREVEKLDMLQNADISKIERVEQQSTDRLEDRWEYFLNKRGGKHKEEILPVDFKHSEAQLHEEQEKFNIEEQFSSITKEPNNKTYNFYDNTQGDRQHSEGQEGLQNKLSKQTFHRGEESNKLYKQLNYEEDYAKRPVQSNDNYDDEEDEQPMPHQQQVQDESPLKKEEQQKFQYKLLNSENISYMLSNSNNPFNHLRTLILIPFKSHSNKHAFLRELTHLIQQQPTLNKPQPYTSLLLLVILLFTEINSDKSIIQPLQYLYEYMAQQCGNNQILKIIIGLYHSVIDQSQENERKFLLTILTKSMARIMPFVEDALELLKDFQQFYQIGEMVYFDMYVDEYQQIRSVIEHNDNIEEVIHKAIEEEGESLIPIVEGWLETGFKEVVKERIQFLTEHQESL